MSTQVSRRKFLQYGGRRRGVVSAVGGRTPFAIAAPGGKLTKYLQPVPLPGAGIVVAAASGGTGIRSPGW